MLAYITNYMYYGMYVLGMLGVSSSGVMLGQVISGGLWKGSSSAGGGVERSGETATVPEQGFKSVPTFSDSSQSSKFSSLGVDVPPVERIGGPGSVVAGVVVVGGVVFTSGVPNVSGGEAEPTASW